MASSKSAGVIAETTPTLPELPDTFIPPKSTVGGLMARCQSGIVATLVRHKEDDMAHAASQGIHLAKAGEGFIVNEDMFPKSPEGYLKVGDCIIGVETAKHQEQRRLYAGMRAQQQIDAVLPKVKKELTNTGVPVVKAELTQRPQKDDLPPLPQE